MESCPERSISISTGAHLRFLNKPFNGECTFTSLQSLIDRGICATAAGPAAGKDALPVGRSGSGIDVDLSGVVLREWQFTVFYGFPVNKDGIIFLADTRKDRCIEFFTAADIGLQRIQNSEFLTDDFHRESCL